MKIIFCTSTKVYLKKSKTSLEKFIYVSRAYWCFFLFLFFEKASVFFKCIFTLSVFFFFGKGSVFFADTLTFSIFFFFTMLIFYEKFFVLKTSILALSVFRLFHLDCDSFYVVFFKALICFFHNILWLFLYIEKKENFFHFITQKLFFLLLNPSLPFWFSFFLKTHFLNVLEWI